MTCMNETPVDPCASRPQYKIDISISVARATEPYPAGRIGVHGRQRIDIDLGGRLVELEGTEQVDVLPGHR